MSQTTERERISRLLIVEDDEAQLHTLTGIMEEEGFEVIGCSTATDALEHVQKEDFGVAVVDLRLPDLSGTQLLEKIQDFNGRIRVIINTGFGSYDSAKEALNLGAYAYVEKAGDPGDLVRHVHRAFKSHLDRYADDLEATVADRTRELREANKGLKREIGERKRAEEEIRRNEKKFRLLYEQSPLGYQSQDAQGRLIEVNPAWLEMFGYTRDEVIGRWFGDFLTPDYVDLFRERFPRSKAAGETRDVQFDMLRKDGTSIRVEIDGKIGYDSRGNFKQTHCIVRDITERKRFEDALKRSEARYRELFESIQEGIALVDENEQIQLCNPAFAKIVDEDSVDDVTSKNFLDYVPKSQREMILRQTQERKRKVSSHYEHDIITARRKIKNVLVAAAPRFDDQGTYVGAFGAILDITERKQAQEELRANEERYRNLVSNLRQHFLYVHDTNGVFTYVSPSVSEILGYTQSEMLSHIADHLTENPINEAAKEKTELSIQGVQQEPYEVEVVHKDGSIRLLEVVETPLFGPDGNVAAIEGIAQDITERKQLEEQLRHAQKMQGIGQLAAGVAHEFNNLLVGILGNSELLLSSLRDDTLGKYRQSLEDINRCGERAAVLTQQLLSFAQKKSPQVTLFDVNKVVVGARRMLQRLMGERIEMEAVLADKLFPIRADEGEIERVILNLAINARDAMPKGGTLTIRTANVTLDEADIAGHPGARPGPHVELTVTDTGCGMSKETVERIFEPFFTTKPVGQGTGLGLSTTFADVTKIGGHIKVDSQLGAGTTFKVYLPQAEGDLPADEGDAARVEAPGTPPAESKPCGSETILVCDDEELVLGSISYLLESQGYTVIRAPNARQALEAASSYDGTVSLLLTDVVMPEMNGRELAEGLTKRFPELKIIYMSGYADDILEAGSPPGEQLEFLQKPITSETLFQRVREVLDSSRSAAP
ncbi:MAG: PAS domain S-box protein [Phycisphaerales bacterium]|nr:MAG: PAS domain S-box protein [Phycisphaerales bacterium]